MTNPEYHQQGVAFFESYIDDLLGEKVNEGKEYQCIHGDVFRVNDIDLVDRILSKTNVQPHAFAGEQDVGCWFFLPEPYHFYTVEVEGVAGKKFKEKFFDKYCK